ncbi:MAG: hypothetical protein GY854_18045, partial [Deltaproteobacteria bacterium]|nr:hypothetical protein [Deltaproteobacteria bacterium]
MEKHTSQRTRAAWPTSAGKTRLAMRLAELLPPHRVYVEPLVEGAAVLFVKEPAETSVVNAIASEPSEAHRIIKQLDGPQLDHLKKFSWIGDKRIFNNLKRSEFADELGKLYRYLYLSEFGRSGADKPSFNHANQGHHSRIVKRLEALLPALPTIEVYSQDYGDIIREYDSPETVFFFDPPRAEGFDMDRFFQVLKSIEGKFIATLDDGELPPKIVKEPSYRVEKVSVQRAFGSLRGLDSEFLDQLIFANYALTDELESQHRASIEKNNIDPAPERETLTSFTKSIPILKGTRPGDERYVLGVVLEPEIVDAQNEIYSKEEIRRVAHRFLEEFGGLGLQHSFRINNLVKILESYLTPAGFTIAKKEIPEGTWLLAVRILDDELWDQVVKGELTGFSVGGSAIEVPEEPENKVTRLRSMLVHEISLVDYAANRHRFLIAKRSNALSDVNETAATETEETSTQTENTEAAAAQGAGTQEAGEQSAPQAEEGAGTEDTDGAATSIEPQLEQIRATTEQFSTMVEQLSQMTEALKAPDGSGSEETENAGAGESASEDQKEDQTSAVTANLAQVMSSLKETLQPLGALLTGMVGSMQKEG